MTNMEITANSVMTQVAPRMTNQCSPIAIKTMKDSNRSFALDSSSKRAAKRLDDPTLSNRAFAIFFIITILIALALLLAPRAGAASGRTQNTGNHNGNTAATAIVVKTAN
jgi:lipopolysaccharide/colanic/teichoic acid biosynthesis glycosyltransferase